MNSTITVKYQTTVPKVVREALGISINDVIEWTVEKGRAVVRPVHSDFLKFRGSITVEPGDIQADIEAARDAMTERFR
ncbi:MAG: hypothetical protein A2076_06050 [Geobacteraceae bacterium GWC2_53_11]|nr:MAG: hypothetical protein A2076_06050 [Geobacteraceae bacterium GWC2_53_11]